jgi:hypothetical protein
MKKYFCILFMMHFVSCEMNSTSAKKAHTDVEVKNDSTPVGLPPVNTVSLPVVDTTNHSDSTDYEHATYYVVVADTNVNYFDLRQKMFALNGQWHVPVDTLGRTFDSSKNLIALPENDEDEMFAGDYYPRRLPSTTLSLEYLHLYQPTAGEKTIALVTGIFETEVSADSALAVLKTSERNSFKIKANMYIGCIH